MDISILSRHHDSQINIALLHTYSPLDGSLPFGDLVFGTGVDWKVERSATRPNE